MFYLTPFFIFLSLSSFVSAGPACAKRNEGYDACVEKCGSKWGWPGRAMGTDPWGSVMTVTGTDDMGAVVTQACRVRPSGSGAPSPSASLAGAVASQAPTFSSAVSSSSIQTPVPVIIGSTSIDSPASSVVHSTSSPVSSALSSSASKPSVNLVPNVAQTSSAAPKSSTPAPPPKSSAPPAPKPEPAVASSKSQTSSAAPPPPPPPSPKPEPTTSTPPPPPPPPPTTKASPTPSPQSTPTSNTASGSGGTSASDINQYLSAHNTVRAQHGATALTWNDNLASKAQQWANGCVFQHSGGTLGPFGENLAAGTGSSYDIAAAVGSWTAEVSEYDPNNPVASHFTQVVWKATTQVGCAEQDCSGIFDPSFGLAKFFVCEYSPQGNVEGEFAQNVQV